jgi:nucleoid-associated protein YgaU
MTSDAKIGLLLGLVFIFVIAFIINGLPNLRPQTGKAEISTVMNPTTDVDFGIADKTRKAQDNWSTLLGEQKAEPPVAQTTAAEQPTMTLEPPQSPQTAGNAETHSLMPSIATLLDRLATNVAQKDTTVIMPAPQPVATEPLVTVEPPQPKPVESITPAPDIQQAAGRSLAALRKDGWKVYTVGEGESLASVAKKMYGAEEGNRVRNIRRIYEANKDILKSLDAVVAGQKLVIPPALPPLPAQPPKPADVLSQALFETVDTMGKASAPAPAPALKAAPKAPAPSVAPATEGRWYVVQDGDNLWKIATSQLGSGTRYEEIAKLNADLLRSKDTLDVGMRIRLPAKLSGARTALLTEGLR